MVIYFGAFVWFMVNAKTLIVYNVTLPYIPERNDKTSPHVAGVHVVHAHAYFQCFKGI
jgi:hypothetical protein